MTQSTATASSPTSAAFRSVAHPQRTGEYACGALGRKTPRLRDLKPSRYDWAMDHPGITFAYTGAGELIEQTDAKGQTFDFHYDALGRLIVRDVQGSAGLIRDVWVYDRPAAGLLERTRRLIDGQPVFDRVFAYDDQLRTRGQTTFLDPNPHMPGGEWIGFEQTWQADPYFGRIFARTDPEQRFRAEYRYSRDGYRTEVRDAAANQALKQVTEHSPRGQLERSHLRNGIEDKRTYNRRTGQITAIDIDNGAVADLTYDYDAFGNLTAQGNNKTFVTEEYSYDRLHRLIERTSDSPAVGNASYRYDALGNITRKDDYAGSYRYGQAGQSRPSGCLQGNLNPQPGPHAVTEVSLIAGGAPQTLAYDANGNVVCAGDGGLNVTYDPYNLPTEVRRSGTVQQFGYGPELNRYVQQADDKTTIYLGRGYEQVDNGPARFQIDEDVLVRIEPHKAPEVHYQHRNRLGSIVAVTDSTGQMPPDSERGYDPWGRPRDADWQGVDELPGADVTPRGFTDHEHIDGSRLIHMNGRAFDPLLGRFLSVDPVIQFPENSQSLNPYSYIMNNPMAGTDPTGFIGVEPGGPRKGICGGGGPECPTDLARGEQVSIRESRTGSRIKREIGTATGTANGTLLTPKGGASSTLLVDNGAGNQSTTGGTDTSGAPDQKGATANRPQTDGGTGVDAQGEGGFANEEAKGPSGLRVGASIGIGVLPIAGSAQSGVELLTGRDFITGEDVSRLLAAAGIFAGIFPGGKAALKAGTRAITGFFQGELQGDQRKHRMAWAACLIQVSLIACYAAKVALFSFRIQAVLRTRLTN
ncbi:MAG: RHS repeat-associated core domain-containing protein [Wenzhouxiangellaceae bacterium]